MTARADPTGSAQPFPPELLDRVGACLSLRGLAALRAAAPGWGAARPWEEQRAARRLGRSWRASRARRAMAEARYFFGGEVEDFVPGDGPEGQILIVVSGAVGGMTAPEIRRAFRGGEADVEYDLDTIELFGTIVAHLEEFLEFLTTQPRRGAFRRP